jgi:hypothetical protein
MAIKHVGDFPILIQKRQKTSLQLVKVRVFYFKIKWPEGEPSFGQSTTEEICFFSSHLLSQSNHNHKPYCQLSIANQKSQKIFITYGQSENFLFQKKIARGKTLF